MLHDLGANLFWLPLGIHLPLWTFSWQIWLGPWHLVSFGILSNCPPKSSPPLTGPSFFILGVAQPPGFYLTQKQWFIPPNSHKQVHVEATF
jgi:hypothetical protein